MAFPQGQIAGKNARVIVGGVNLAYGTFTVDDRADEEDTTTFEDGGFGKGTIGIEQCDISFGGLYDITAVPYDDPPGIYPRDDLANVYLVDNVAANQYWQFFFMLVLSSKNGAAVRDRVTHEASGKSQLTYVRPTI